MLVANSSFCCPWHGTMRKVTRFLAVIAIALAPVIGVQTVDAASSSAPSRYPVWPSFLSTGCSGIPGAGVSVTVSCGQGGYLLTQFNSGYQCNEIDIFVNSLTNGPFKAVGTVNSGSVSNTLQINDAGNWYMQFPFVLVNNLITLQITAENSGGVMDMGIVSVPCNVPTDTPTVNPSFTPTNTRTPTNTPVGSTYTITPIPTFTPLPSGHNTFTPTATPIPATGTATPTNTPTPGPSYRDCGDASYPLLNCDFIGGTFNGAPPTHWAVWSGGGFILGCWSPGDAGTTYPNMFSNFGGFPYGNCNQTVIPTVSGTLYLVFQETPGYFPSQGSPGGVTIGAYNVPSARFTNSSCAVGSGAFCTVAVGTVTSGVSTSFLLQSYDGANSNWADSLYIKTTFVSSTSATFTPTNSPTTTSTLTPAPGTSTPTPTPTQTPVSIPGAMSTNIPTATECPGGCAVAQLTQIPGLSTRVTVDTSPFSALSHLSLARSSCAPFGFAQIPYPHIIGTPAYGSTTPLSYTWTVDMTSTWNDTNIYSNTAIQPCAMTHEIPTLVWDFTYWLSVVILAVGWFLWLIGFVGRLSGEETING